MTHWLADRIAVINGLLVLLTAVAIGLLPPSLRPWTPVSILPVATGLALIAAWRSRVHARAWIVEQGPAWRGVIEAILLGPAILGFLGLAPIISRLFEAPGEVPGVVADLAGIAAPMIPIGLAAGLVLRFVALLQLRRAASHA